MSGSTKASGMGQSVLVVVFPFEAITFFELDVGEEKAGLANAAMAEAVASWKGRGPVLAIEEDDVDQSTYGDHALPEALLDANAAMVFVRSCKRILAGPGAGGLLAYLDKDDAAEIADKLRHAQLRQAVAATIASAELRPGLDVVTLTGCYISPEKDGDLDMLQEMFESEGVKVSLHPSAVRRVDLEIDEPQAMDEGPSMA